ncbi:MAG: DUF5056 domain-containing protein [Prevotella sp.]|nr:DUF5056 domain-containing protein [Prevotella sp.]
MTDNDNLLIENFFKQAAQQQIEDNGFTERVMEKVVQTRPSTRRMSILWTCFCVAVALALFILLGGWESLKTTMMVWMTTALTSLEVLITTAPTTELPVNPAVVLLLVAFVLVYLPYQTARKLSATL